MTQFATFDEAVGHFLKHFGVKGMRWGVRNDRRGRPSGTPMPVTVTTKPGKRVQARGGQNRPATDDAKKAAALKQKARASTIDSLSNTEIRDLITRLNLEQQYAKLDPPKVNPVKAFLKKLVVTEVEAAQRGQKGPGWSALESALAGETPKKKK